MIEKISNMTGQVHHHKYKRWISVNKFFGDDTIVASKIGKDGSPIELIISKQGKKRELISKNEKITDIVDKYGLEKKTYTYKKDKNVTYGTMRTYVVNKIISPLVTAAKWVSDGINPIKVTLTINPEHKGANLFVPKLKIKNRESLFAESNKQISALEVIAKDFEGTTSPLPKTLLIKTKNGSYEQINSSSGKENLALARHFGITTRDELGQNLRTIV